MVFLTFFLYSLSMLVVSVSIWLISLFLGNGFKSRFVRRSLFIRASYGEYPVAGCGIDLYPKSMY